MAGLCFTYQRDEISLLHDLRELLSPVGARLDLVPEEVAGREVREAVLGHDALALGALPAPGPAWKEFAVDKLKLILIWRNLLQYSAKCYPKKPGCEITQPHVHLLAENCKSRPSLPSTQMMGSLASFKGVLSMFFLSNACKRKIGLHPDADGHH